MHDNGCFPEQGDSWVAARPDALLSVSNFAPNMGSTATLQLSGP